MSIHSHVAFSITAFFVVVDCMSRCGCIYHKRMQFTLQSCRILLPSFHSVLSDSVTFISFCSQMNFGTGLSSFLLLEQNRSARVCDEGGDLLLRILQGSLILFNSEKYSTLGR